jgi:hypothetical protein
LAAESLGELAHLPERIAESLDHFKLGAGGSSSADDGDVCAELGPGAAAGLAALCGPMLNPTAAAGDGAAGATAASSTSGLRCVARGVVRCYGLQYLQVLQFSKCVCCHITCGSTRRVPS